MALSKSLKFQSQKAGRYSCVGSLSRSADTNVKTAGLGLDRCNVLPHLIVSRTMSPLHTRITNASRRAQSPSWKTACAHGSSLGSLRPERRLPAPSQGSSLLGSVRIFGRITRHSYDRSPASATPTSVCVSDYASNVLRRTGLLGQIAGVWIRCLKANVVASV
jgi:hypothetical protein